jgi:maltooligosyltrehalose trehalohydrolase
MTAGRLGATAAADGTRFEVWAPRAGSVTVELEGRSVALEPDQAAGTWVGFVPGVGHGDRYRFRLDDGEPLADPASGWQPDGVFGPSAVVDAASWAWTDEGWSPAALEDAVLYELHVGTFTPGGTLDAAIAELERLAVLGVTHVELMPINQFAGDRNWGYDGVFWSAVQDTYGGPDALARFVDAAHGAGLGVVLDVVYNHVGPLGSVLHEYGPYFTDVVHTPWGPALNVAEAGSDTVRRTILESAARWIEDFHVDGLRVDAIHAIHDPTARPLLEQLTSTARAAGEATGRSVLVIAESSDNDPRVVRPPELGGLGFDAVWDDDFHHALRVALTGDRRGYYVDYGGVPDLAHVLAHRWLFADRWSTYRGRTHGRAADDVPPQRFVVFTSNHDHVGNTPAGARPPFDDRQRLLAAAAVLLSPFTPMLFMGEEHADPAPFPYFVGHDDAELLAATREGRRREFRDEWTEEVADPGDPATFRRAVLDPSLAAEEPHRRVLDAYTELLAERQRHAVLRGEADQDVAVHGEAIVLDRHRDGERAVVVLAFGAGPATVPVARADELTVALDTATWLPTAAPAVFDADGLVVDGPGAVLLVSG